MLCPEENLHQSGSCLAIVSRMLVAGNLGFKFYASGRKGLESCLLDSAQPRLPSSLHSYIGYISAAAQHRILKLSSAMNFAD